MIKRKIIASEVEAGDLMAVVSFVKVVKNETIGHGFSRNISVTNLDNEMEFQVVGDLLIEDMLSADRFVEEREVSRTNLVEILMRSYNKPITVYFIKKDGSERKIRGRLVKTEPLFGRSVVEDLDKEMSPEDNPNELFNSRTCQADHRTIFALVADGVLYKEKRITKALRGFIGQ